MFRYGSSSSISFATVTPSLVIVGEHVPAAGAERHLHRTGQHLDAVENGVTGFFFEQQLLRAHA
jgi:hypothetical protein